MKDMQERGLGNVSLELVDNSTGQVLDSVETDSQGNYHFLDVIEGVYRVRITKPSSLLPTFELDDTLDGETLVELASGGHRTDIDFGFKGM